MANTHRPTFAQREGIEPLPTQLDLKHLSGHSRAVLWNMVFRSLSSNMSGHFLKAPWNDILRDWAVEKLIVPAHDWSSYWPHYQKYFHSLFSEGPYHQPLGFLEYVLRHEGSPIDFSESVEAALRKGRTAYTVVDGDTIAPMVSEEEGNALREAIASLQGTPYAGAKKHLKLAAQKLGGEAYAESVRESIGAVESVASMMAGKDKSELGAALDLLKKHQDIHGALLEGFKKLYGYTSDQKGIRHALLEGGDAKVDFIDAAFMLGACSSFVSYLIGKGRAAGLTKA